MKQATQQSPQHIGEGGSRRVLIVGAGISGLGMARRLRQDGLDVTILEKADKVGGTWLHNRYPGLKCDIPLLAYRYSHEPIAGNSRTLLPSGTELQQRAERLCDASDVRDCIRFNAEIVAATWTGEEWELRLADGDVVTGDIVVWSTGFLHHAHIPEIPGLSSFGGTVVHSAEWRPEIQTTGKRVAIIGSGSSGCQITSALAGHAARTMLYARNPQWILPVPDVSMPAWLTTLLHRSPRLDRILREGTLSVVARLLGEGSHKNGIERKVFSFLCRRNLARVKDPGLRARLTPNDAPLCKRPVMTTSFYPAVQRGDVDVITDRIETVTETGVRTVDGTTRDVDLIILATGYHSQAFMRPIHITGEDGATIADEWDPDPYAYHSISVPKFPNMFMTYGPLSPRLHVGVHESVELLGEYVVQFARALDDLDAAGMSPTREATSEWVDRIREAAKHTSLYGCTSWYQGTDGVPLVYTLSRAQWRIDTGQFDVTDYEVRPRVSNRPKPEPVPSPHLL